MSIAAFFKTTYHRIVSKFLRKWSHLADTPVTIVFFPGANLGCISIVLPNGDGRSPGEPSHRRFGRSFGSRIEQFRVQWNQSSTRGNSARSRRLRRGALGRRSAKGGCSAASRRSAANSAQTQSSAAAAELSSGLGSGSERQSNQYRRILLLQVSNRTAKNLDFLTRNKWSYLIGKYCNSTVFIRLILIVRFAAIVSSFKVIERILNIFSPPKGTSNQAQF